ncbi:MAG: hypothetical protein J6L98_03790, partial [Bacteroidales bacterium]|nr:hypothetical protein [Bacteroidales bacterium]
PKFKIRGKSVVVYFEEDLEPDMTYTLDLTGAIVDNNESNPFPGFTTFFSTGESVDSMYVTGSVYNCENLKPIKGATVLFYKDQRDSAVFQQRPVASARTDDWGFFALRNIKDTLYRAYAIVDANGNNIYDPDEDRIGFIDTLIRPLGVISDSIPELVKYNMKDTLSCLSRHSDISFNVFREKPSKQMVMNKKRTADRAAYITFMSPEAEIDSLWFKGFPAEKVITEFNVQRDSLLLWLNDSRRMPDTLKLFVKYMKTDSAGVLTPVTEDFSLVDEKKPKGKTKQPIEHNDTICPIALVATPENFEHDGISMEFTSPPILGYFDSLSFVSISPKQVEQKEKFTIERDSLNLRRYIIKPQVKILDGYEYEFKVPHRTFKDINGFWNDSTKVKVSLPKDENLSSFSLNLTGVKNKYIVHMLDDKKSKVLREYVIDSDATLAFPYLKKGSYCIRITEDLNRNGIVDTGNLLKHRQPEKVRFIKKNDKDTFEIPERSEIVQDLDVEKFMAD